MAAGNQRLALAAEEVVEHHNRDETDREPGENEQADKEELKGEKHASILSPPLDSSAAADAPKTKEIFDSLRDLPRNFGASRDASEKSP
jgi:hypothetical protein